MTQERIKPRDSAELRCPYCHDGDFSTVPSLRCEKCLAWQHAACSQEAGKCGACSAPVARAQPPKPETRWQPFVRGGQVIGHVAPLDRVFGQLNETLQNLGPAIEQQTQAIIRQGLGSVAIVKADGDINVQMGNVVVDRKKRKKRFCFDCGALLGESDGLYCAAHKRQESAPAKEPEEKKSYITLTASGRAIADSLHIRHAAYAVGAVTLLVALTILGVLIGRR